MFRDSQNVCLCLGSTYGNLYTRQDCVNFYIKIMHKMADCIPFSCCQQAPAPMAFPMTTPQVPVYGMVKNSLISNTKLHLCHIRMNLLHIWLFSLFTLFVPQQLPPQMTHQMGGVPIMPPQPVMYNQPVLRPTNPFGPIPGTQVKQTTWVYFTENVVATFWTYAQLFSHWEGAAQLGG